MKNLFPSFAKLAAVVVGALSLGSCNRAEYAMLPKSSSYHGETRMATSAPVAKADVAVEVSPVTKPAVSTPEQAIAKPSIETDAVAPSAAKAAVVATLESKRLGTSSVAAAPVRKLNLVQRIALNKVTRKLGKLTQKASAVREHTNAASIQKLDGKLRQGIVLLLVGLLVGIIGGAVGGSIGYLIGILGLIVAIVGIVLIILYLLDSV